jgi:putative membrane protein
MAEGGIGSPSDYLAAERTFLAWIRTGLGLMGFGFVVARFGLFLREIAMTTHDLPLESTGASLWMGTALLLLGAVVNVAASINHVRLVGRLNRGDKLGQPSRPAIVVALTLAFLGLGLAAYLVLIR